MIKEMELRNDNWMQHAKCNGMPPEFFYPRVNGGRRIDGVGNLEHEQSLRARYCHGLDDRTPCPVRLECLNYAIKTFQDYGVWGGTTEKERVRIRRSRKQRIA